MPWIETFSYNVDHGALSYNDGSPRSGAGLTSRSEWLGDISCIPGRPGATPRESLARGGVGPSPSLLARHPRSETLEGGEAASAWGRFGASGACADDTERASCECAANTHSDGRACLPYLMSGCRDCKIELVPRSINGALGLIGSYRY